MIGELLSLTAAFLRAGAAVTFEKAGKLTSSLIVNTGKLLLAAVILPMILFFRTGQVLPLNASCENVFLLSISGIIGFYIGDLFLFRAFIQIGARLTMLILSFAPVITALFGFLFLHETPGLLQLSGILIVVAGIVLVILHKKTEIYQNKRLLITGIFFAVIGTFGDSIALIISKKGIGNLDPFAATELRIWLPLILLFLTVFFTGKTQQMIGHFRNIHFIKYLTIGSLAGPILAVTLGLAALRLTYSGIVSSIIATVPVILLVFSIVFKKEKISLSDIAGSLLTVAGVILLFMKTV